jgi:uncharacterized protein YoxC
MKINEVTIVENRQYNLAISEAHQLDEISWQDIKQKAGKVGGAISNIPGAIQRGAKAVEKGANKYTKGVAKTGDAVAGAANALGRAGAETFKQTVARPVSGVWDAGKNIAQKATGAVQKGYGDVKQGVQTVGKGVSTAQQDIGNVAKFAGNTAAKAVGGTAGAVGSVAGGATTGVARAAAKGFNKGVQATGGNAVNKMQSNIMQQPKAAVAQTTPATTQAAPSKPMGAPQTSVSGSRPTSGAVPVSQQQMNNALNSMSLTQLVGVQDNVNKILSKKFPRYKAAA